MKLSSRKKLLAEADAELKRINKLNEQLDNVWEDIIWKYVSGVQDKYAEMASKMSPFNGWKFIKATHDLPGDSDEWVKTTKAGKKFSVTFYPFWETNPVFACAIIEDGEPYKGQYESFKVKVTPSGEKEIDAKKGIKYIQEILKKPEFE